MDVSRLLRRAGSHAILAFTVLLAGGDHPAVSASSAPKAAPASAGRVLVLDPAGDAHEVSRRETAEGVEIRISIDLPDESVPAGAEARASFRLEGDAGGEGAVLPRLDRVAVTDAGGCALDARVKPSVDESGAWIILLVESEGAAFPLTAVLTLSAPSEASMKNATSPAASDSKPAMPRGEASFAAPANDNCAGAISLPSGPVQVLTTPVDVIDATITGDPMFCVTADRTIWYVYTAPVTGNYVITTCASAGAIGTTMPDTVLAVLSTAGGCAAPGPGVACNDDDPTCNGGAQSTISTTLTGGQSYYIIAARYAGVGETPPAAGATSIQILITRTPQNDTCAGTIPSLTLDIPVNGTTLAASNDYQLQTAPPNGYQLPGPPLPVGQTVSAASGRDIIYSFTAPATGAYSFRVTDYSPTQNAVLYVSSSCPTGAPPVTLGTPPCVGAANRTITSGPTAEEVMCVPMSAGQTDYVLVDDAVAGNAGSGFRLEVNRCAREDEPNNTPATANALSCPVEGSINPANNADFYAIGTPASGSRLFAISDGVAANSTDQQLRVTTSVDTLEFDDDDNFTPFGSLSPNLAGSPLTGVPVYLRMSPFSTTIAEEPYRLYAVVQPPLGSATAETEPNGDTATADTAGSNYFSGALAGPAPSTDVDVFRFKAQAGTLIMLNLDGDPLRNNTPINPKLDLLDAGGNVVVSVNEGSSGSSTTTGAGSLTSVMPFSPGEALTYRTSATGTYYARVSIGTTSATAIGAGDYLLSIALDCASGDLDADGVADANDCAPSDASTWRLASEARNLIVTGKSPTTLSWSASTDPGTSAALLYDTLRATAPNGFGAGTCLASDIAGTSALDSGAAPAPGGVYDYLVRTQNLCGGNLGTTSAGVPRTGRSCP
jgi:hypothetical protein